MILVWTTPAVVFAGAAVLFAGAAIATYRFRNSIPPGGSTEAAPGVVRLLREMVFAIRGPGIRGILVVSGLRTFVRGMWLAIAVIASIKLLHAGSAGVGLLMLAAGIGSLIAAPISSMVVTRPRLGNPAAVALLLCGVPLALIAEVPVLDVALVMVAAWGIGMAVADVATSSLLHRLLEAPTVPRVTGAIEATKLALEGLGAFLAPLLVATIGVRGALLVAALPLPFVVVSGWTALHQVDHMAGERAAVLDLLHAVNCLQPLDMATLDGLVGRLEGVSVREAGTVVIRQGDRGDRLYIIESGEADVLLDGFAIGTLRAGQSFGERALLRDTPRTATIRSRGSMRLLALSREDFLTALTGQEGADPGAMEVARPVEGQQWTGRDRADLLSQLTLFSHLDSASLGDLADRSIIEHWAEGSPIVSQGDHGDRLYVILRGQAAVTVDGRTVNEVRPGDQFGEIALLHGVPRSASVTATMAVETMSLSRADFTEAVRDRLALG